MFKRQNREEVKNVFTPTRPARSTFVEREQVNEKLVAALMTPGKQIVVYGHTGSGKTTLTQNKLTQLYENHITTRCYSDLTFEQILLSAFDKLAPYYDAEKSQSKRVAVSASLQTQYIGIKSIIGAEAARDTQVKQVRALPQQLTPQSLATFLGEAKCCWVLEDFHKVSGREKKKLAQVMKLFMDMSDDYAALKIVAIGAVDTARQVVAYDPEMRNRVSEILVPPMTDEEVRGIIDKGEDLLNISFPPDIKDKVIQFSNGFASVCHQLCLNMCFAAEIYETLPRRAVLGEDDFMKALDQYVEASADTLKNAFDKALRWHSTQKYNDGELILKALLQLDFDGATRDEILEKIREDEPRYYYTELTPFLKKLQTPKRGSLLRFDEASGRFSFSENIYRAYAATYFEKQSKRERGGIDSRSHVEKAAFRRAVDRMLLNLKSMK